MSEVNEQFARLFFENCNYFVRTNVKYYLKDKGNIGGDSDIDLLVINLKPEACKGKKLNFTLTAEDLKFIKHASIEIKGWHEEYFTRSTIKENPKIFNFVKPEATQKAKEILNTIEITYILIVSALSPKEPYRSQVINRLKEGGINHIIEFSTIVNCLWDNVAGNKSYQSEILQTIRLINKYMDLTTASNKRLTSHK